MTVKAAVRHTLLFLIESYQKWISPMLGPKCRFYPTCSQYAHSCLNQYSVGKALQKSAFRILKCHPFHPGGVDLP